MQTKVGYVEDNHSFLISGVFDMDRLSYKDGYLKGIDPSLNTLLQDGIISKKQ